MPAYYLRAAIYYFCGEHFVPTSERKCTSRLKDGQEVTDLRGQKGTYRISTDAKGKKVRFVVIPNSARSVEVVVVSKLLPDRGYRFQSIGE